MDTKQKYVGEIQQAIEKLNFIIDNLEGNAGWTKLMELMKEQVTAIDENWHLIPVGEEKRLMEARAAKMAYSHLVNWIEFAKSEVQKGHQTIKEIESDSMSD